MRIALLDPYDHMLCFLDNDVPECMHYTRATLSTYLAGDAYTMNFAVASDEENAELIAEGCKIAFRADLTSDSSLSGSKDYYLTIVQVERDEDLISVEAWGLTLELTNEEVDNSEVPDDMSISGYLAYLGFERDVLTIDDSRLAGEKRRLHFDSRDSILHRIYALAEAYDAEASFEIHLKPTYQLDKINLVFYPAGDKQGMGQDRTSEIIRYGSATTGIKKTVDISNFYTAIRPRGKNSSGTVEETTETWTYANGAVRTLRTVIARDDQKVETRRVETIHISGQEDWVETRINVVYTERDGRVVTMPEGVYTCSARRPSLPSSHQTYSKQGPVMSPEADRILTLSGFGVWRRDDKGSYLIINEDIRCPEARDRFPASLAKNDAGAFKDGYIVRYMDVPDADDQGSLYEKALKELQNACVPKVSYQLTGYMPGNVGDWVTVEDSQYDPPIYLQCRIIEQKIDLCEPWRSSSKFDNFTTLKSQISPQITSTAQSMAAAEEVYDLAISSTRGTVFEDGQGSHTFTASVRRNGINATDDFRLIWTFKGSDIPTTDPRVDGASITIDGSDVTGAVVLSCRAVKDSVIRGSSSITLTSVYTPKVSQKETADGNILFETASGGKVQQSTIYNGKDGFSPTVTMSKLGDTTTLTITDQSGPVSTQIEDGKDGVGISSVTTRYCQSSGSTTPAQTSSSWSTTLPTPTAGYYLHTQIEVTKTNGTSSYFYQKVRNGSNGTAGKDAPTIKSITGYYYRSTSQSTVPADSSFSTSRPTLTATYKYLWTYDRYTLSDGTTLNGPKHIGAVYGDTGQTGSPGADGDDAKTISGISTVWATGYSASTTAPSNSSFSDSKPATIGAQRLWRAEKISCSDGSSLITNKRCVYWSNSVNSNESDGFIDSVTLIRTEHNGVIRFRGYVRAASSGDTCTFNLPDLCGISFVWANYFTTKSNALSTAIKIELSSGGVLKVTASGALSTSNHLDFEIPIIIP